MKPEREDWFRGCPKSNRIVGIDFQSRAAWLLFPFVGFLGLIWFLIRVIPKPSRAEYPCMKVAAPLASSFVGYLAGLGIVVWAGRRLRINVRRCRWVVSALCVVMIAAGSILQWSLQSQSPFAQNPASPAVASLAVASPAEQPNVPIGVAKGLHPGRVVWARDPKATTWDGQSGNWWTDDHVDQPAVNALMSKSIQALTGADTDREAWDQLFRFFNREHGRGDKGYQRGEKVVIKINCNVDNGKAWSNTGYSSPQAIYALVSQLIDVAGVAGGDITIADPSRTIGDPIVRKIAASSKSEYQNVWFASTKAVPGTRRIVPAPDANSALYCDPVNTDKKYNLPRCYTEAAYMINLALLRPHRVFGVTLCAKNHAGSIYDGQKYTPAGLHHFSIWDYGKNALGDPHCHPGLMGHKDLGGKTVLYMLDGLYTAYNNWGGKPIARWQSLDNQWCASLLASQDPVAIDSVGLDLIRSEQNLTSGNPAFTPNVCNYLREAAQAQQPPSGAAYDPEHDGSPLPSLGAHEHWNNPRDRQYSRNLGTGKGIELVRVGSTAASRP
jgi:hypothetical protein